MPRENERSVGKSRALSLVSFAEMRRRVTGKCFAGDPWPNEGMITAPLRRIIRYALRSARWPPLPRLRRRRSE